MRKCLLSLILYGLSTSIYSMIFDKKKEMDALIRSAGGALLEKNYMLDFMIANGITQNREQSQLIEDSFNQLSQHLQGNYEYKPLRKWLLGAMWQKKKEYENKLQELESKLKKSEDACANLSLKSRVDKLCDAVQKLDDAKETLRDRLIYGAGGVIIGWLLVYFASK